MKTLTLQEIETEVDKMVSEYPVYIEEAVEILKEAQTVGDLSYSTKALSALYYVIEREVPAELNITAKNTSDHQAYSN